jgi:hypothetical protein
MRIGLQVGCRRAQQSASGAADGLQYRPVGAVRAQFTQLGGLGVGQVGVELFEPLAVVLLCPRSCELADAGEEAVLERERRCLDDEIARTRTISPAAFAISCSDSRSAVSTPHRAECTGVGTTTASRYERALLP